MNRIRFLIFILITVLAVLLLTTACGGATPSTTKAAGPTTAGGSSVSVTEKTFTADELAAFDGKNGNKAYIAVNDVVYDVTAVAEWGSKLHAGKFVAGKDYSAEIKKAPHGVEKLLTAVKIGVLKG